MRVNKALFFGVAFSLFSSMSYAEFSVVCSEFYRGPHGRSAQADYKTLTFKDGVHRIEAQLENKMTYSFDVKKLPDGKTQVTLDRPGTTGCWATCWGYAPDTKSTVLDPPNPESGTQAAKNLFVQGSRFSFSCNFVALD